MSEITTTDQASRYAKSLEANTWAQEIMPGGVSSPVRAYKAVGRIPVTIKSGDKATVTDIDGNIYIDYVLSYGPLILGHTPEPAAAAMSKVLRSGWSFGMPTELESQLAQTIVDAVPAIDLVRFVNSGTEAVMSAIRLARAATVRDKIIKCTGCYHGHSDSLLVQAGSGATTLGVPSSPGVPAQITAGTVLIPFNDIPTAEKALAENDIAALVIEPIAGNMGCIPPQENYLQTLRDLCDKHGTLLIFDEVMTGFRVAKGCAQSIYNITPDLTCLGKVVGGGLPCAAYGGREDLMRKVAPDGPVYQAGTLSGNPLAMAAGLSTLETLFSTDAYAKLESIGNALEIGLKKIASDAGVPVYTTRVGSMIGLFFSDSPVHNYEDAVACDTAKYSTFFSVMLDQGVILAPSAFETWFVSTEHDQAALDVTFAAAAKAFAAVAAM
ncbi:glutamate-1-semialdehyde 2,1-aminomutase [Poriferisphaera sp. WC338]|uniref:glutamate-1-semialdehyde 2,1-aminomutase n=1 Tax=Poriferisphaera sp. WC338 TaxID=3425129 RepID=UPI003D8175B0